MSIALSSRSVRLDSFWNPAHRFFRVLIPESYFFCRFCFWIVWIESRLQRNRLPKRLRSSTLDLASTFDISSQCAISFGVCYGESTMKSKFSGKKLGNSISRWIEKGIARNTIRFVQCEEIGIGSFHPNQGIIDSKNSQHW